MKHWTPEEDALLRRLWASEAWIGDIVALLGRNRSQCAGRAMRLGCQTRGLTLKPVQGQAGAPVITPAGVRVMAVRPSCNPGVRKFDAPARPYHPAIDPKPEFLRFTGGAKERAGVAQTTIRPVRQHPKALEK